MFIKEFHNWEFQWNLWMLIIGAWKTLLDFPQRISKNISKSIKINLTSGNRKCKPNLEKVIWSNYVVIVFYSF